MKLDLPSEVDRLRRLLIYHRFKGRFFGGCIRDFLLHQTPNDYDIIVEAKPKRLQTLLHHYNYNITKQPHSKHLFISLDDGSEVQIMERLNVPYDFTINRFHASLVSLEIKGSKISFQDLERNILRAIDTSPRVLRRGLYMLYKYPQFRPTKSTISLFRNAGMRGDREILVAFLEKKQFPEVAFRALCVRYGVNLF